MRRSVEEQRRRIHAWPARESDDLRVAVADVKGNVRIVYLGIVDPGRCVYEIVLPGSGVDPAKPLSPRPAQGHPCGPALAITCPKPGIEWALGSPVNHADDLATD